MTRKIELDEALERALTLFWEHGYRGTSLEMLTTCLGVEKPSIYASFGSKHQLYVRALQRYRDLLVRTVEGLLRDAPTHRTGVENAVRYLMTPTRRKDRKGCFATNSALELADHDEDIRKAVTMAFEGMIEAFARAIKRAQADGSVRADVPAAALARLLVNSIEGVRVLEKTDLSDRSSKAVTALAIGLLDEPGARATRAA